MGLSTCGTERAGGEINKKTNSPTNLLVDFLLGIRRVLEALQDANDCHGAQHPALDVTVESPIRRGGRGNTRATVARKDSFCEEREEAIERKEKKGKHTCRPLGALGKAWLFGKVHGGSQEFGALLAAHLVHPAGRNGPGVQTVLGLGFVKHPQQQLCKRVESRHDQLGRGGGGE